jgi:DNA-binding MarR family transcriptional regulator
VPEVISATATESPARRGDVSVDDVAGRLAQLARLQQSHRKASPPWLAHELTFSQVRVLFLLREQGPMPMSRLAEILGVTSATASGIVERIERRGLVERLHRAEDRRVVECALTEQGERITREMAGARLDAFRQMLAVLTPAELAQFDRLLTLVAERLAARAER